MYPGAGTFVLIRPAQTFYERIKLPFETHTVTYDLEYGASSVEMHVDALDMGQRVLIVDDLLATGGTLEAAARLVEASGGKGRRNGSGHRAARPRR